MADQNSLVDTSGITAMEHQQPFKVQGTKYDYESSKSNPSTPSQNQSAAQAASESEGTGI